MEYRSIRYAYGDAVSLLDRLLGRWVSVEVDGEPGFAPPAAAALFGILGRWNPDLTGIESDFEQAVVAFFSVADSESEGAQGGPVTSFALSQTRFLDAERLLVPGEHEDSVAEGGSMVIRLRGGVMIDLTWHHFNGAS